MFKKKTFQVEFTIIIKEVNGIPAGLELETNGNNLDFYIEWKRGAKKTGTTKIVHKKDKNQTIKWDESFTVGSHLKQDGDKFEKKILEFDLIEIGFKGKKTRIAKGTLNLSLYIKGDPAIRFPLILKNKKLGDSPLCVISVSTKFVKLNHMAMIPADNITSGDNTQIVSIDGKNYQLRHTDDVTETSLDTITEKTDDDDPQSDVFDDEEHNNIFDN